MNHIFMFTIFYEHPDERVVYCSGNPGGRGILTKEIQVEGRGLKNLCDLLQDGFLLK